MLKSGILRAVEKTKVLIPNNHDNFKINVPFDPNAHFKLAITSIAGYGLVEHRDMRLSEFPLDVDRVCIHSPYFEPWRKMYNLMKPDIEKLRDKVMAEIELIPEELWAEWPDLKERKKNSTLEFQLQRFEKHSGGVFGEELDGFHAFTGRAYLRAREMNLDSHLLEIFSNYSEKKELGTYTLYGIERDILRDGLSDKLDAEPELRVFPHDYNNKVKSKVKYPIIKDFIFPYEIDLLKKINLKKSTLKRDEDIREKIETKNNKLAKVLYLSRYST